MRSFDAPGQRSLLQAGLARKVSPKPLDFVVLALLPCIIFSLVAGLFGFAFQDYAQLVWALVGACSLLSLLFISMGSASGKAAQVALGILLMSAIGLGVPVGLFVERRYMRQFWEMDSGATYREVDPASPSASHADASVVHFQRGTFVDTTHSVGYMENGKIFCVAPIVKAGTISTYWAVGKNCCQQRGDFKCGDAHLEDGVGVVVHEGLSQYQSAARMATATYSSKLGQSDTDSHGNAASGLFVQWISDASTLKSSLWDRAMFVVVVAAGLHLAGSGTAALILGRALAS
mmetsp:Transcript_60346/g.127830  ORF Transcript_60346/g.127830 Transcript_60346/m.127830 type:complete len:290 (+) Transcript_60346:133-1002(+)